MAWRWPAIAALLVLTAGMAGCIGGSDAPGPNGTPTEDLESASQSDADEATGELSTGMTTVLSPPGSAVATTVWANGSFAVQDNCFLVCQDGPSYREAEVDGELIPGAVNDVTATLSFDRQNPALADALQVYGYAEDGTFYAYNISQEAGGGTFEALFVKGESPLVVVVAYEGPPSARPELNYTLRIDVEVEPSVIPAGVPVELSVTPGQRFVFEAIDGSQGIEILAHGPDDVRQARLSSEGARLETSVPLDVQEGKHVLVPTADSAPIRILTNGTTTEMRALPLSFEAAEPHAVQPHEAVNWTFEPATAPLAVGIYQTNDQAFSVSGLPGELTLQGPNGTLLEHSFGCGVCVTGSGYGMSTWTTIGAAGVGPGSYQASYQPTAEAGYAVGHILIGYER